MVAKQSSNRRSIFNILLARIFFAIILFSFLSTGLIINEKITLQRDAEKSRLQRIQNQVKNEFIYLDRNLNSAYRSFYAEASDISQRFCEIYPDLDLKTIDLKRQLIQFGVETSGYDIYIIENGIIVNTTDAESLGSDLYSLRSSSGQYLKDILNSGIFECNRFTPENSTMRFVGRSYQPTLDKKYIIEIRSHSDIVDGYVSALENGVNAIMSENDDIRAINIWLMTDEPYQLVPFKRFHEQDSLIRKVFLTRESINSKFTIDDLTYTSDYIFQQVETLQARIKYSAVISIIKDITDSKIPIFNIIRKQIIFLVFFLVSVLLILHIVIRRFKNVLSDVINKTTLIANGALKERVNVVGNNELRTLAEQFNYMVENIEQQNQILLEQKNKIADINALKTESITYAKYIQEAILPQAEVLDSLFKDYFILHRPRDIVSGDFYWVTKIENITIIAVSDCTGHGVPGALMSMLGVAFLNEIVNKEYITHPAVILRRLRKEVIRSLHQCGEYGERTDGMDIALCAIDYDNMKLQFSGANNPLYLIRDSGSIKLSIENQVATDDFILYEVKGDRMPISFYDSMDQFKLHEVDILRDDIIYLFTDGFADQFGGPERKKLQYKNFKKMLLNHCILSMEEQKNSLSHALDGWQGDNEQVDDILVFGLKI